MVTGKRATLALGAALGMLLAVPLSAQAAGRPSALPSESEWLGDVAPVAASLQDYLKDRLAQGTPGEKPAVVLDIDNTSLATHYDRGKPVEAILKATGYAHEHGAAVLFASYRGADEQDSTTEELRSAGYTVDGLCLKPHGDSPGKAEVKLGCRKKYEAQGYTLVANVGNRSTDFEGGHYEKGFKLPDYDGQLS
ncbi:MULTISPECIES: HAD family acid phosphatase [Streptomyces]|uniref:Acid phosphatase n=2 Tax=Streptomyces TaxID=1883 RepID=A0A2N8PGY3_STRNR|nr:MULTISPECIES: HAD family acid phosphatase [Streptomyces]PNE40270.1 acid phosphatase [Streptomyces noursei]QRX89830.1 acid phosphatase [Streptomyces noursei]UJB39846.1 acid phosphatase [Streptomyces sp. A1-5]SHL42245.1 HAD superfamily, subfamily IIIB (Acid phosphatase) [Streptomyces yunnanensis]